MDLYKVTVNYTGKPVSTKTFLSWDNAAQYARGRIVNFREYHNLVELLEDGRSLVEMGNILILTSFLFVWKDKKEKGPGRPIGYFKPGAKKMYSTRLRPDLIQKLRDHDRAGSEILETALDEWFMKNS